MIDRHNRNVKNGLSLCRRARMCLGRLVDARKSESHKEISCPCQSSDPPFRPPCSVVFAQHQISKLDLYFVWRAGIYAFVGRRRRHRCSPWRGDRGRDNNSCGFSVAGQATFGATWRPQISPQNRLTLITSSYVMCRQINRYWITDWYLENDLSLEYLLPSVLLGPCVWMFNLNRRHRPNNVELEEKLCKSATERVLAFKRKKTSQKSWEDDSAADWESGFGAHGHQCSYHF
jgi:hypothetical protein